jgi:catechol 2,3-dioxygenase-like lactoylglutathione lyase family enzyme
MAMEKIEHCAIRTAQLEATRFFYTEILGLEQGPRPELPVAGYWLYAGDQAVIHLIEVNDSYTKDLSGRSLAGEQTPGYRQGLDHIAFRATGLAELLERLKAADLPYGENIIAEMDFHQVFVADPNGVMAELNFLISDESASDNGN